jgi:hypothetical protein
LERAFVLAQCSDGHVLEIGTGTGRITAPLSAAARSVTAIDASAGMLSVLRGKVSHPKAMDEPEQRRRPEARLLASRTRADGRPPVYNVTSR